MSAIGANPVGNVCMLGKLKQLFGSKPTTPSKSTSRSTPNGKGGAVPKPKKLPKVNIERRFTIVSETARGSMSRVYRAVDNTTGRSVCLKVQHVEKNAAAAARTSARLSEGEIGTQLVHPNIVRTFDFGLTTRGEHFIVMEYVDGLSLQYIRETGAADLKRKLELLAQGAEALAYVHASNYIHHDINPRNFLVDREGTVKLIDFGLAVPNTSAFRKPGNRTGSLQYMAPELIRRESTDERLDTFAYGAVAFELLTGRLPHDATNSMAMMLQRINTDPLDPARADPTLPAAVCAILRKGIARRKEERWPKIADMAKALREAAEACK